MIRGFRAFSTVGVMLILLAMSLVIFASYGAQQSVYGRYKGIIHRERAQLLLNETFEALEAMRLTVRQQDYLAGWKNFIGSKRGNYKLVHQEGFSGFSLEAVPEDVLFNDDDKSLVRLYDEEDGLDGIYTRLERRIIIDDLSGTTFSEASIADQKTVTVVVYWGVPGGYGDDVTSALSLEMLYSNDTAPSYVL